MNRRSFLQDLAGSFSILVAVYGTPGTLLDVKRKQYVNYNDNGITKGFFFSRDSLGRFCYSSPNQTEGARVFEIIWGEQTTITTS